MLYSRTPSITDEACTASEGHEWRHSLISVRKDLQNVEEQVDDVQVQLNGAFDVVVVGEVAQDLGGIVQDEAHKQQGATGRVQESRLKGDRAKHATEQ